MTSSQTPATSPGVSMTTIRAAGRRPVCAGCSTTFEAHCQTCGTCPTKPCPPICADMKAAQS